MMKRMLLAGAVAVLGVALIPSAGLADPPTYIVTQCGESTCYVLECTTFPNINDTDWGASGCSVIYSYPRPREVSGE